MINTAKPRRPTKITKSFSMDDKTCDIILGRAMRDFYGRFAKRLAAAEKEMRDLKTEESKA